jgi:hypothetical protein
VLLLLALSCPAVSAQNAAPRTPSDTVREFYRLMREKRFREAFALSIYRPAVEGLSQAEMDDLRPDFEKMAAAIPEKINIAGEQISGETATVFVKVAEGDSPEQAEPVTLMRSGGSWIVGDKDNQEVVRKGGKDFFFKARVDTHHGEVQAMLQRIMIAEAAYSQQHNGKFADLAGLIAAGLVPKDLEATDSTGYRFHVTVSADGKSYTAGAEPAVYGRTGRLSFSLDQSGIRSGDAAGKPLLKAVTSDK